jgi:hypothetical protein
MTIPARRRVAPLPCGLFIGSAVKILLADASISLTPRMIGWPAIAMGDLLPVRRPCCQEQRSDPG